EALHSHSSSACRSPSAQCLPHHCCRSKGHHRRCQHVWDFCWEAPVGRRDHGLGGPGSDRPNWWAYAQDEFRRAERGDRSELGGGRRREDKPHLDHGQKTLRLRSFFSDYDHLAENTYKQDSGLYNEDFVQTRIERADEVEESGSKLSGTLHSSGRDDISILAIQGL
ncbi:unnamed protein product, partial [Urochloa humidicola]